MAADGPRKDMEPSALPPLPVGEHQWEALLPKPAKCLVFPSLSIPTFLRPCLCQLEGVSGTAPRQAASWSRPGEVGRGGAASYRIPLGSLRKLLWALERQPQNHTFPPPPCLFSLYPPRCLPHSMVLQESPERELERKAVDILPADHHRDWKVDTGLLPQ